MSRSTSSARGDRLLLFGLRFSAAIAGAIVVLIFLFVLAEATPALRNIGPVRFFSDPSWHPKPQAADGAFNLLPMLSGTLFVSAGALFIAVPVGVLAAVFLHFYAPRALARPFRRIIELLAGIPSVVYGLWGLIVLVPLIARLAPPGPSLLAGVLVLALMVLPTVALTADAALRGVPAELLAGAAALGLSRYSTWSRVALPAARSGLATGGLLAAGRAIGETMAVLMVCGNIVQTPKGLFEPMRALTANIALEMAYALGDHRSALFVSGLLLLSMVAAFVALAEFVGGGNVRV